ncbi:MAG: glycosyltransferase [Lachnospiraceae bacterium]|nr:glycosyltransferase [Lachnospiraceae bacterium]
MIPKIIHYCWFGGKPLPDDVKKNIETWKKYCPHYEIKEWNEKNFDLHSNKYVWEAYENKKWAFITDYVRLYAMVNEGGIYMDTDVEVIRPLDSYLKHHAFSGFETEKDVPTGIMASERDFPLYKELLDDYKNRAFVLPDGSMDLTSNVYVITKTCLKHGLIQNNMYQSVDGFVLYPSEFFCPKNHKTGEIHRTNNTVTIHHFAGSWVTGKDKKWLEFERKLRKRNIRVINVFFDSYVANVVKKLYVRDLKSNIKKIREKL